MVLYEAECEAVPLLERVLHSFHVVHPHDAVAAEGIVDGVVQRNGEGDAVQRRRAGELIGGMRRRGSSSWH